MRIIVVGGGVSGLYAAYRILQKYPSALITILEKLSRLGGRIMTEMFDGHVLEYGPMRFEPDLQQNFAKLLKELGICTKHFPPYTCPSEPPDFNKLSFEEIQAVQKYKSLPPAFAILKYALVQILDEQWDVENDDIHAANRDARKAWLKKYGTFQGRYLHNHGLWDTLAHVLSKEALDYLQHKGTFYHMLDINPNAGDQICFMLDILATAHANLVTIEKGTYHLIDRLREEVSHRVEIRLEETVEGYTYDCEGDAGVKVSTDRGSYPCDHVIFTCQRSAYKHINGFPQRISELIDSSTLLVKLFKIFVIIDNPPFDESTVPQPNYNAHLVPCRELHFGYDKATNTGMVMLYGDVPTIHYWRPFREDDAHMKNHVLHYLRCVFADIKTSMPPFSIKYCRMMDWSREPYTSGVHLWRPTYQSEKVIHDLTSIVEHHGRVHVCGETFSDYQGFIEGCLRTVDKVVDSLYLYT